MKQALLATVFVGVIILLTAFWTTNIYMLGLAEVILIPAEIFLAIHLYNKK